MSQSSLSPDNSHNFVFLEYITPAHPAEVDFDFPGTFAPSISHTCISLLEQHGKLLHNYTQNIDTLEDAVGITRAV